MRLLLINPNTSAHITERLAESARSALRAGDTLTSVTAARGPQVVRNAEQLHAADANALELADIHAPDRDAIVLGISLDGVARRLRERHPLMPVVGMTEAALLSACLRVERIGLLTLGGSLLTLYRQHVEQAGSASRVVAYQAPELHVAFDAGGVRVAPAVLSVLAQRARSIRSACCGTWVVDRLASCRLAQVH